MPEGRRLLGFIAAVSILTSLTAGAATSQAPQESASQVAIEYREVPLAALSYADGKLTAEWDTAHHEISDVVLAADLDPVETLVPGRPKAVELDPQKRRYDLMGWMTDRSTGERVRFISPVRTASGSADNQSADAGERPMRCSLTEDVECPDGSLAAVTCSGENGTCYSCSVGQTACCKASVRQEDELGSGRVEKVLIVKQESQSCPPPPEPRPNDPPRPRTHNIQR